MSFGRIILWMGMRKVLFILQLLTVETWEFIRRYRNYKKNQSCKNPLTTRKYDDLRRYKNMIKILLLCYEFLREYESFSVNSC